MEVKQLPIFAASQAYLDRLDALDPRHFIIIKGARANNLKNVSVAIPRNNFVVVTGLSGSGKSSLAFDTLFAEGQRMYVESLNAYIRQFLGRMQKPDVDYIRGVAPAIAIEQKVANRSPRSTVGTVTEIYDYLKLLYARIGHTYSPISGKIVKQDTIDSVVGQLLAHPAGTRMIILCPLVWNSQQRTLEQEFGILQQKGFSRIWADGQAYDLENMDEAFLKNLSNPKQKKQISVLIDRIGMGENPNDEEQLFRISDSVQTAFNEGEGRCTIEILGGNTLHFSNKFEADGMEFEMPSLNLFSFTNPYGVCKTCEGHGTVLGIDKNLVIPDHSLSVFEGAIAPWRSEKMNQEFLQPLLNNGIRFDFPIHRAWQDLSPEQQQLIWQGNKHFKGINSFFEYLLENSIKVQYRVMYSRYRGKVACPECNGSRLRKEASYVRVGSVPLTALVLESIDKVSEFFNQLELEPHDLAIAKQLLSEINSRLHFMQEVGLGYLSLNRLAATLSGGEYQRIRLATSLGSALVGSMYILDEPSIGLHPRDTQRLIVALKHLQQLGNTVIVVEHEEEIMRAADQIIDIGPEAGQKGGHLIFQGTLAAMMEEGKDTSSLLARHSHTYKYLSNQSQISTKKPVRQALSHIKLEGASIHNIKNVSVKIPLNTLTVVTGVSGSGKSSLIGQVLTPAICHAIGQICPSQEGTYENITGIESISEVVKIDQNPIGRSSRSNPISYLQAFDGIRELFAEQPLAKQRGYRPSTFSFNVDGGRCPACDGEGVQVVEMQFMADVRLVCESCGGTRYKKETLEVLFQGRHIADVLHMSVDEAITFFEKDAKRIAQSLMPLQQVGLGYIALGQSSDTLSGGEAQRIKLAYYLSKSRQTSVKSKQQILFIFDEPTTGLHFHDIRKLLEAINALVDKGHTALIIEHNMDVIRTADWIIDIGPDAGMQGGKICFEGTPQQMLSLPDTNHTARFLKQKNRADGL